MAETSTKEYLRRIAEALEELASDEELSLKESMNNIDDSLRNLSNIADLVIAQPIHVKIVE